MTHVKKRRKPVSSRIFDIVVYILLFLVAMVTIVPFLQVVTISLSPPEVVASYGLHLIPTKIDLEGYRSIFKYKLLWTSYRNTIVRTLFGTALSMFLYVIAAYPLSKKYLPNRRFWIFFIIFTMYFSGGMIPNYLLINNWLKLSNTIWALILPPAMSAYNLIIVRNFFESIPDSLEESARIDGARETTVLFKIVVPLSMPGITTGITMVFVPSVSTFIISRMLGGGQNILIGDLIEQQFLGSVYNPYVGSAMSLILMVIILLIMSVINHFDDDEMEGMIV